MTLVKITLFVSLTFGLTGVAAPVAHAQGSAPKSLGAYADEQAYLLSMILIKPEMERELRTRGATPYTYDSGWGWVRTDFYAISVTLPDDVDPRDILDQVRDNPASLAGDRLEGEIGWPAAGPDGRRQYDVINLDIFGDDGAIAYIDVDTSDNNFTVITVENTASGTHPVSGIRRWGFTHLSNGRWLFWAAGIESTNVWGTGDVGAALQESCWTGLMRDIGDEVIRLGGEAHNVYSDDEWQSGDLRPGLNLRSELDSTEGLDVKEKHLEHTGHAGGGNNFIPF